VKLLLDENLSKRLVPFLQADYPDTSQVVLLGLEQASDREIWQYAKQHDYVIVTKDSDYQDLNELYGSPPQVILLMLGNSDKARLLKVLIDRKEDIQQLLSSPDIGCIEIE
jgi:predicted nuclease of predicted toxin-antitoxin system